MDNILAHSRLTAQAALQAQVEHLAMMSRALAHDLKNLITPVSSFLVHTDHLYAPDTPEGEVHAEARRAAQIMTDYVREAMLFSEHLAPQLQPVELSSLFSAVRDATATRAQGRHITLKLAGQFSGTFTADRVLLLRLLANLVHNAIDASPRGATVTLRAAAHGEGHVRLSVKDTGCGIPPENLGRVFEPYFTTKRYGEDVRGFGLGLTICQKIVNLHGGRIAVASTPGKGTIVHVDLPVAPPAQLAPARPCLALP